MVTIDRLSKCCLLEIRAQFNKEKVTTYLRQKLEYLANLKASLAAINVGILLKTKV